MIARKREHFALPSMLEAMVKLRKAGYSIPDSTNRVSAIPAKQEVVKLDMTESPSSTPLMVEQDVSHLAIPALPCIAAEIRKSLDGLYVIVMVQLGKNPMGIPSIFLVANGVTTSKFWMTYNIFRKFNSI